MNIINYINRYFRNKLHLYPNCVIAKSTKINNTSIYIEKGSLLILGSNVKLVKSNIFLTGNSKLIINDNSSIYKSTICLDNSKCEMGNGLLMQSSVTYSNKIYSENSEIKIGRNVRLAGINIYSRFGSLLEIGEYSGFSGGSEIFCHEHIKIGKFALVAEDVCIYDTNTHSTDTEKRIYEMEISHPSGLWDKIKPKTVPIIIGDNVWVGKGAALLKGVILKNNCIVGMKTIVGGGIFDDNDIIVNSYPRVIKREL